MVDEYIRKQDAFDEVNHALDRETILFSFVRKVAISALKGLHTADVVPVVHAYWRDTGSGQECSACKEIQYGYDTGRHYCANCGAKMDGEE